MSSLGVPGLTIWFTGLPCSGKTTLGQKLACYLRAHGKKVEVLDGDEIRQNLSRDLGFTKEDRDEHIRRLSYVARLLTHNGIYVIVCAISPYRQMRQYARNTIGYFFEVYLKCPVEVCMKRDVKGLYAKALSGEIQNFTGISDTYEEPLSPELVLYTDRETPEESLKKLICALHQKIK